MAAISAFFSGRLASEYGRRTFLMWAALCSILGAGLTLI